MKLRKAEKVAVSISLVFIMVAVVIALVYPTVDNEITSKKICSCTVSDVDTSKTELININNASLEELCTLPGIGEVTAEKIINYRIQYGDFRDVSSIIDVSGIGLKTFEKIKDKITV